ncbi:MAG: hypothetical protein AUH78_00865 [Gemmatimonadetes bacterium 13_1_40CM_4_69_8]|nr:MAG: hypothetical protein AUH78_00865 [Gemmatimonadetes bacterium 13_1_40CM_4_69_8]
MTMRPVCGLGPRLGLALALAATPAAAQHGIWLPVRCDLKPNHYLVNAGLLYLKSAAEGRFQEQIQKDLKDANRNLLQAVTANGQDQNPAAWYYLGRYYGMVKDAAGADSAFRRAEQLKPACKDDIAFWRRDLWVPLYNGAVAAYNAAQSDSAIHLLQQANAIYAGEPTGFKLLGALFYNANEADSAARYFRLAIAASSDPKYAADKKEALFNVAASYYRAQRWPEAEAAYKDYLGVVPSDAQALAGLAAVYTSLGRTDSATAIYTKIVNNADSVDAMGLFFAGTSIFSSAPPLPDTAATGTSCRTEARRTGRTLTARAISARCDSVTARRVRDYDGEVAVTYRLAAKAFEAGLAKNPFFRDGLFNLANTYLALHDSARMLPVAQRLYAVDPMNRSTLRLLAQGFQFQKKPDSTLHYLMVADTALPFEVTVGSFLPGDQNATLSGLFTNYRSLPDSATLVSRCRAPGPATTVAARCGYQKLAADAAAKLTNAPLKVTFEFLNAKGEVVVAQSVDVPAIEPGGNHPFQLKANGAKIEAWRYKQS